MTNSDLVIRAVLLLTLHLHGLAHVQLGVLHGNVLVLLHCHPRIVRNDGLVLGRNDLLLLLPWQGFVLVVGFTFPYEEGFLRDPGTVSETGQEPILVDDREGPLECRLIFLALGLRTDQVRAAQRLLGRVVLLGKKFLIHQNSKKVPNRIAKPQPEPVRRDVEPES